MLQLGPFLPSAPGRVAYTSDFGGPRQTLGTFAPEYRYRTHSAVFGERAQDQCTRPFGRDLSPTPARSKCYGQIARQGKTAAAVAFVGVAAQCVALGRLPFVQGGPNGMSARKSHRIGL